MQLGFYELQLLVLASVCTVSIVLENYIAKKTKRNSKTSNGSVNERLEDGVAASMGGSSALSSLMRRYLVVYAIVMGESRRLHLLLGSCH
jgi:hypothetical protein